MTASKTNNTSPVAVATPAALADVPATTVAATSPSTDKKEVTADTTTTTTTTNVNASPSVAAAPKQKTVQVRRLGLFKPAVSAALAKRAAKAQAQAQAKATTSDSTTATVPTTKSKAAINVDLGDNSEPVTLFITTKVQVHRKKKRTAAAAAAEPWRVQIKSKASGKNLSIDENGVVSGNGANDASSHFDVISKSGDVIVFRNVQNPKCFLRINPKRAIDGVGRGGSWCHFKKERISPGVFSIVPTRAESKGTRVGVLPSGQCKDPSKTGKGTHGQFMITCV
eukprot:TRINITY_DN16985_c0_g1_i1.p1 TRINITY_DN16985_c0_g1~~TRINITY_DN16985_c0_g1_i1.p1  ORF type:complete len:298 (+),score=97.37 TRINITY_DN16985_c0_g1_i1:51-896(+)